MELNKMDWITLLLLEFGIVELLAAIALFAFLAGKQTHETIRTQRRFSLREVEKEAEAIASAGRKARFKRLN